MSRKDRKSRGRPGRRAPSAPRGSRTAGGRRSTTATGWHTYKSGGLVIYVNPFVSVDISNAAVETLVAEHSAAAEAGRDAVLTIAPGLYATAHQFRGQRWFVVTDTQLVRMYIAPAAPLEKEFGWKLTTGD